MIFWWLIFSYRVVKSFQWYWSPSNGSKFFLQGFEKLLKANQVLHPCVVVVDMKLDLLQQNENWKAYLNLFLSIGFKQTVTQPTKTTVHSESCMHHVLTNDHNIITPVLKTDISDHFGLLHEIKLFVEKKTAKKEVLTFRNFHKAIKNDDCCCKFPFRLLHELRKIDYNETHLDELIDKFTRTLKNHLDMYFPETASQPVERRAFRKWNSKRAKNVLKNAKNCSENFWTIKMKQIGSSIRNNPSYVPEPFGLQNI